MAGRIPQPFIDDLLERTDIVEVIDRRVPLKKSGRNYSARCPFHDEKTPSFTVSPDKQFYYCFGCGAGGNAIGFIMDFERLDFPRAVENLAQSAGLDVPREESTRGPGATPPSPERRDLYTLMEELARFYREQLRRHPQAQRAVEYLKRRGLSGGIARDFGLGYAPPGWDAVLERFGGDDAARKRLLEAGMLVQRDDGRSYDRFRDRVMFPIRDSRGRIVAFGGRVLGDDTPKYLNSPETPIFHKGRELYGLYEARRHLRHIRRMLVVEGYMDVVALAQFDIRYSCATLGTATNSEHLRKIFRQCPEVVFCFDGDRAGRQAARRALEAALPVMEDGRQARFLFLPEGEDPDTLVRSQGREAFEALVQNAIPLERYLFDALSEDLDPDTMEGRARLARLATPLLRQLPGGVYRQLMLAALAERTGLTSAQLEGLLQEAPAAPPPDSGPRRPPTSPGGQAAAPRQRPARALLTGVQRDPVLYALGLLILHPRLATRALDGTFLERLTHPQAGLLQEILALLQRRPDSNTHMLIGQYYEEPARSAVARAIDQAFFVPESGVEREFTDTLEHLRRTLLHQQLDAEVDKLRLRNYAELSPEEKIQLRHLLTQKHSERSQT